MTVVSAVLARACQQSLPSAVVPLDALLAAAASTMTLPEETTNGEQSFCQRSGVGWRC